MNPVMLYMLTKDKGSDIDPMLLLCMSGAFNPAPAPATAAN
jgi:hypothetical protein